MTPSSGAAVTRADLLRMLRATGDTQAALFERARRLRARHVGDGVLVRGVIEISNRCRVNCSYCPMRRDNSRRNAAFTLMPDEILAAAREIKDQGIDVVFLQGGETPQTTPLVLEALPRIREIFGGKVEILLNLGNQSRSAYRQLKRAGATSFILKHETSDPALFQRHREEPLAGRLACLRQLLKLGFKVGTGSIVGLPGQTLENLADDILLARDLGVHMTSGSPFVPAPMTPLEAAPACDLTLALNAIAAMRIANPACLIPAVSALEGLEDGGQRRALDAGANVLTVNFTPRERRQSYLIYGKNRFLVNLGHVGEILRESGLTRAPSRWAADVDAP